MTNSDNRKLLILTAACALSGLAILLFWNFYGASAFTGPSSPAGIGVGAIGVGPSNELSVGTSTTQANTRFLIAASSTDSLNYALRVIQPNGTSIFSVKNDGNWSFGGAADTNLNMNGRNISAVNKLTATTIDPLYEIRGKKYATYVPSLSGGVKEEYTGKGKLVNNEYILDFDEAREGSDLWLWRKVTDFSKENVEVVATPYGKAANLYYVINGNKIIIRGDKPVEFSYRLTGKRYDWRQWPTLTRDQAEKAIVIE